MTQIAPPGHPTGCTGDGSAAPTQGTERSGAPLRDRPAGDPTPRLVRRGPRAPPHRSASGHGTRPVRYPPPHSPRLGRPLPCHSGRGRACPAGQRRRLDGTHRRRGARRPPRERRHLRRGPAGRRLRSPPPLRAPSTPGPRRGHRSGRPGRRHQPQLDRHRGRRCPQRRGHHGDVRRRASGQGSGVVIDAQGPHPHQQPRGERRRVQRASITVTLNDGRTYKATVAGTDPSTDLAVITLTNPPKRPQAHRDRQLRRPQGRRPGHGDRQPARPRGHRHHRHRQRPEPARDDRGRGQQPAAGPVRPEPARQTSSPDGSDGNPS